MAEILKRMRISTFADMSHRVERLTASVRGSIGGSAVQLSLDVGGAGHRDAARRGSEVVSAVRVAIPGVD
jgi:hypothetical protein